VTGAKRRFSVNNYYPKPKYCARLKLYSHFGFAAPAIINSIYCTLHSSGVLLNKDPLTNDLLTKELLTRELFTRVLLKSKTRFLPTDQGDGR
jgi:hypothetical protein